MEGINLFWSVYKNLEKEFLQVAQFIHFSDNQMKVYSVHIADLIIRCAIEIEAISKELYIGLGGSSNLKDKNGKPRELYFDTDCLNMLEERWRIGKKQIIVSAANFYFTSEKNRIISPLHKANKRGKSGSKWKQSYQELKHNRKEALDFGNIGNLLNAMGALYILNLYYRGETFPLGRWGTDKFDARVGSEIFSVAELNATQITFGGDSNRNYQGEEFDKAIYLTKFERDSFITMMKKMRDENEKISARMRESQKTQDDIIKMIKGGETDANTILNKVSEPYHHKALMNIAHGNVNMEAIINKNENVYPTAEELEVLFGE